jgi:hypothetical protein
MKRPNVDRVADAVPLHVRIPKALHGRYKAACAVRGLSMTEDLVAYIKTAARLSPRRQRGGRSSVQLSSRIGGQGRGAE